MRTLLLILFVGCSSYWLSDIKSPGILDGFVFPLTFVLSILSTFAWIALRLSSDPFGKNGTMNDSSGFHFSFRIGGDGNEDCRSGDCGGGDDGGGGDGGGD